MVADGAVAALGGIDILVDYVGAGDRDRFGIGEFLEIGDNQWRELLDRNLFSEVWMTHAALPSLIARRERERRVGQLAGAGHRPSRLQRGQGLANALGKRLSEEFAPRGVRVNTVSPGVVGSSLWRDPNGFGGEVAAAHGPGHQEFLAAIPEQAAIASGRSTEPEEVAALITFLASRAAANIVGADMLDRGAPSSSTAE